MKCLECNYDLSGVTADVCPECGAKVPTPAQYRAIIAARPTDRFVSGLLYAHAAIAAPFVLSTILAYAAAVRATLVLGHWPRCMLDDPKGIRLGFMIYKMWNFATICAFYAFVCWIFAAIGTLIMTPRLREHSSLRLAAMYGLMSVPLLFIVLFFIDPGNVFCWLFD